MKKKNKLVLTKEEKDTMIAELQGYFLKERDEELGDLAASLLLDFIVEKLGPDFYNKGIHDSSKYMIERAEELLSIQK